MERRSRISLDNPAFHGRIRTVRSNASYVRPYAIGGFNDLQVKPKTAKPVASLQPRSDSAGPSPMPVLKQKISAASKPRPHLPKQARSHVLKRQMVKVSSKRYRPKHRRPLMPTLLSAMAVTLFLVGVLTVFNAIRTDRNVKAQVKGLSSQKDDNSGDGVPSEDDPPKNLESYKVAPDLPRLLNIEKLGVNTRIRRLGVSPSNVLKAPANIFDAGWYDGSAKPGENGTVVIDGHVSGPTQKGVFYSIGTLKADDVIKIERGDGQIFTYKVTGSQVYDNDKVDMAKVMTTSVPGKPGLNLVTCTGRFNVRTNTYEQRVVVFAVQLN